jgi:hypothetical protein
MLEYDKRGVELLDEIKTMHKEGDPAEIEKERAALPGPVLALQAARTNVLMSLVKALQEASPSKDDQVSEWRNRVSAYKDAVGRFSNDALRNISTPTVFALAFVQRTATAEAKLVEVLAKAETAARSRDYIVKYQEVVSQQTKNLETKWNEIVSQHKSFEQQEKAAVEDLERLITEAALKAKEFYEKAARTTANAVVAAKDAPESVPGNDILSILGNVIDWYRTFTGDYDRKRSQFERYFREEAGSVMFLFKDFREDTQEFIEKYGYKKMLDEAEEARRALAEVNSSGAATPAGRADVEAFVKDAIEAIGKLRDAAQKVWDDFAKKHEKKFFGAVGPDVKKALLDRDMWEKKYERLVAINLHSLLEQWRNGSREYFNVDMSGLKPEVRDALKDYLANRIRELHSVVSQRPKPLDELKATFKAIEEAEKQIG